MPNELLAECRALALEIAPELQSAELRILEHQPGWPMPASALGYAIYGRHLLIRDYLKSTGDWPGKWPSTIVLVPGLARQQALGVLVHEAAHVLPTLEPIPDDGDDATDEQRQQQDAQLSAWASGSDRRWPWQGHGPRWIRRCLHLHHRAKEAGVDIDLQDINVAGAGYGLSMPSNYAAELGSEPQYFSRRLFAEIENEPMPPRFRRLFCRDALEFAMEQVEAAVEGEID